MTTASPPSTTVETSATTTCTSNDAIDDHSTSTPTAATAASTATSNKDTATMTDTTMIGSRNSQPISRKMDHVQRNLEARERRRADKEAHGSKAKRAKPATEHEDDGEEGSTFIVDPTEHVDIVYANGLRYIRPYYFTFKTYAKGRWINTPIIDMFTREFAAENREYYTKAIESGKITVNGNVVPLQYIIKNSDLVTHLLHRHEPPVLATPISVVHQDDDYVVVDKPPSMPVHPCGRYRHNTLLYVLAQTYGLHTLHLAHRLDRLTSGLLILSKNVVTARKMEHEISSRNVQKEYICKVDGVFPTDEVVCDQPIKVVSHKLGVCAVNADGKTCRTTFTRLSTNGTTSIVKCLPETGRMHQIRVHLQYLGHPIVGDPVYNTTAWGPFRGKACAPDTDTIERVSADMVRRLTEHDETFAPRPTHGEDDHYDALCKSCQILYPDPTPDQLFLYLHAYKYTGPDWAFQTPLPPWATEQ